MSVQTDNQLFRKPDCAWGEKAATLLREKSISFEDHIFPSKQHEQAFKEDQGVATTPQVFLEGKRVGGYTDLMSHFGKTPEEEKEKSYIPVVAVFSTTGLMALATYTGIMGFMGLSLCVLACLKLMNIQGFVAGFKKYDLLTRAWPFYGRIYPFAELFVGLAFISGVLPVLTGAVSLLVGTAGGISVYKAVYLDKTDLNCACIGGNSNVPLGIISFTENAMMAVMGLWLLIYTL